MHLVIDSYGADPSLLASVELIHTFLDQLPDQIGMTKVAPPQVYTYRGQKPHDWGVSGFVLIAESHVTIHTFPRRGYANIDVFSCKEFDAQATIEIVTAAFGLERVSSRILDRGLEFLPSAVPADR